MKPFSLGIGTLILRFYAMMGVIVLGGFTGQYWLMLLALPIFLSAMMGVKMGGSKKENVSKKRNLQQKQAAAKAA
ncbi:hypothetical protein [Flavilitoribacter nigricans]|uniref:Uncharacterized protein n=1 Tax=Flavilitoribacter nigricans (strain ATCC 23147 / DSM 23189 / NBRC 102662 / NCIMB 1420 / SS-2) TaxID=1122177 RepID=A0A2D0MZK0_FLAN2|nr:hypothetical protein [Flavilitoribacter nigricans]PHN00873.1 hypothetical protein CRP01_39995 [Flavilitoribacter nigricans DSM 23189 = NBRC 102662]